MAACASTVDESGITTARGDASDRFGPADTCRLRAGDRLGGHEIVAPLCAGGMGELYDVMDPILARPAVAKVLHRRHFGRCDHAERLLREARLLAELGGAHVPLVYGAGRLPDARPFFVMERLCGRDLRAELRRVGVMSVPTAVRLTRELLASLDTIHARGVVHRDVKLENVLFCETGRIVLVDFGLARRLDEALRTTAAGVALGTLRTMAPEQHAGADVDDRADVYAAGIVLYELVTGRGPFDHLGRSAEALRFAHCRTAPAPPSSLAPQPLPRGLDGVVLRALAKRPAFRFASARAMSEALEDLAAGFMEDEGPTIAEGPSVGALA